MSKNKTKVALDPFQEWAHRFGRICMALFFIYMLAIPTIMGITHNCMPSLRVLFTASFGVLLTYIPLGISETVSYTPILGSSTYLAFLTGNIMNLKLPCAINAMKVAEVDQGTPEGDAVSAMAVAASSIFTVIIIAIGVVMIVPLQPILTWGPVATATNYMLPAMFGTFLLGLFAKDKGEYQIHGKLKGAVVPFILWCLGFLFLPLPQGLQGLYILITLPFVIGISYFLFKKGKITVEKNPDFVPLTKEK